MKGIDSSTNTLSQTKNIVAAGYQGVGIYLRADRCSAAMVAALYAAGVQVWSVYERGYPTTPAYFSAQRGAIDGAAAAKYASQTLKQPQGTQIYAAVDFDPDHNNSAGPTINGPISDYMKAFQAAIKPAGYVSSVYGSGRTCRILMANGLAKAGWLCQSTSFAEHVTFAPHAAIVQGPRINNSWDGDDIPNAAVAGLW